MTDQFIFHYEDEPHRVDLPGLIEVALYRHKDIEESSIQELIDSKDFLIQYRCRGEDFKLRYVIEESIAEAEGRAQAKAEKALLHLVDLHIGATDDAGIGIVEELKERKIAKESIWMVTAYEGSAKSDQRLKGIEIYPKPSPLSQMVEKILKTLVSEGKNER